MRAVLLLAVAFLSFAQTLPEIPAVPTGNLPPLVRSTIEESVANARANPQNAAANGFLGMVLQAHNFPHEAEICYRRARQLDPDELRWAYYLAYVQAAQANCADAATSAREALRIKPQYLPAKLILGKCLVAGGEWDQARELYEAVIREYPSNAEAHYGLGRARTGLNDLKGAIQSFRKACDLFPDFGAAHFAAARVYLRLGNKEQAATEMALSKDKDALFKFPETEDPLLDEVVALYKDYDDYIKLGDQLRNSGKLEHAADAYEQAVRINPQLYDAHVLLIQVYDRLGQPDKAEQHYRAAAALQPAKSASYYWYAVSLLDSGNSQAAAQAFRKTLEVDPRNVEARINLAYILEAESRLSEATQELDRAVKDNPDSPQAHFSLGRILTTQENFAEGIPHLLKALTVKDEQTRISYLHAAGMAYAAFGDLDNALRYLHLARAQASSAAHGKDLASIDEDLHLLEPDLQNPPDR